MARFFVVLLLPSIWMAVEAADNTTRVDLPIPATGTGAWHVSRAAVDVPQGATTPVLIESPRKHHAKDPARTGSVHVSFDISEKGIPFNIQVDNSSDKQLVDEVIAMIREWRFEASMRNGIPTTSHGYMDLVLGDLPIRARPVRVRRKQ